MKRNSVSILSFAAEKINYILNNNERFIKWGPDNKLPQKLLELFDTVPEHSSSINFTESLITANGIDIEDIDIWTLKKIVLDFIVFGGYTVKVIKLRNGSFKYEYIDISKCRFNKEKDELGYSDEWEKSKVKLTWYPVINSLSEVKAESIFYFKNNKSRELYPRPSYLSGLKNVDTASSIAEYHNSNAKNGFTPSTIINFNNGEPDDDTKAQMEKAIKEKFTGPSAQRFILSFQESADQAVTISKLDNDALDQKFETLQKFVQNEIIIAHQITSGQLIGVKPENTGFSKQEYDESLEVFKSVVVNGYQQELEHSFSILFNKEVKFIEDEKVDETIVNNDNNIVE